MGWRVTHLENPKTGGPWCYTKFDKSWRTTVGDKTCNKCERERDAHAKAIERMEAIGFKVGDFVRYKSDNPNRVLWEVIAQRRTEVDIKAPSGYVGTIVMKLKHVWEKVG